MGKQFLLSILIIAFQYADAEEKNPTLFFTFGLTNILAKPNQNKYHIQYANNTKTANDTFRFDDAIKSNANLINFNIGFGGENRYIGGSIELGLVPFANRNYHQNINFYFRIPVSKTFSIQPGFGYFRLRKRSHLGTLKSGSNAISFRNRTYEELDVWAVEGIHNLYASIGARIELEEQLSLLFEIKYLNTFRNKSFLRVNAFGGSSNDPLLLSLFPDRRLDLYGAEAEVIMQNADYTSVDHFFKQGNLAFSAKILITLGQGSPPPTKWPGIQ